MLNGEALITGGTVSKLHLIFARACEDGTEEGIGGSSPSVTRPDGLRLGHREPTMGLRAIPEMEVIFEDMYVGPDMVVMPPSGLKRGFADLMNAYNAQRVGAGTVALGLAQGAPTSLRSTSPKSGSSLIDRSPSSRVCSGCSPT